jgi:16S rRNA (uracil1498-N3)-methyltransferase
MRLHRFYSTETLTHTLSYTNTEHLHQWRNGFRYTVGDSVILFGDDFEHTYTIEQIDKKVAHLRETDQVPSRLHTKPCALGLALIKKDNFELVLEKCTELGVTDFYPFTSERSLQKMYGLERLEKILIEASEQSGWGRVPILHSVQSFEALVSEQSCIVYHMSGEQATTARLSSAVYCIGPEGGYSESEIEIARKHTAAITSLAGGVLRAETAAIAIASLELLS